MGPVVTPSIDKYFRLRGAVLAPMDGNGSESAVRGVRRRIVPLERPRGREWGLRSEEHTSELQSRLHLVCRLLLEKKKYKDASVQQPVHCDVPCISHDHHGAIT